MSKQFEFRVRGDKQSFLKLLEKNNIQYSVLTKRRKQERPQPRLERPRLRTQQRRAVLREVLAPTMTINQLGLDISLRFLVALTPLALQTIWKWYKRKRRNTQLSITVEGNVLDLNAENMEILMSLLKETAKKKRRKRGEPK